MQGSKLSKLGVCILATRGKIEVAKWKNMDPEFQLIPVCPKKRFHYNLITTKMVSNQEKNTWIEEDHLGDWNPEEDCCWPTLSHPTQMTFFNQGLLLLKKKNQLGCHTNQSLCIPVKTTNEQGKNKGNNYGMATNLSHKHDSQETEISTCIC